MVGVGVDEDRVALGDGEGEAGDVDGLDERPVGFDYGQRVVVD